MALSLGAAGRYYYMFEDMVGEGSLALVRAARHWRPDGGASFSTYAFRVVQTALLRMRRRWSRAAAGLQPYEEGPVTRVVQPMSQHHDPDVRSGESPEFAREPPPVSEEFSAADDLAGARTALRPVLAAMQTRHRDVLLRRFGLPPYDRPQTLEVVAADYGVTRERVRQIETAALARARGWAEALARGDRPAYKKPGKGSRTLALLLKKNRRKRTAG